MTTITAEQAPLFGTGGPLKGLPPVEVPSSIPVGLRPAAARLVATACPDMHDKERRELLFLVVECPFCDCIHIHPGGHRGAPRLCVRRSRCIGRPAGAYYFPEVQS